MSKGLISDCFHTQDVACSLFLDQVRFTMTNYNKVALTIRNKYLMYVMLRNTVTHTKEQAIEILYEGICVVCISLTR